MTGEMNWIKPNGDAGDGSSYPLHATVARRLRVPLRPFDTYAGPYIATSRGKVFLSVDDDGMGMACLWPGGVPPAYCEPITCEYSPVDDSEAALEAVRNVLKSARAIGANLRSKRAQS